MGGDNKELADAVKELSGFNDLEYESALCKVSDINLDDNTCTCTPINGDAAYFDVILSSDKSKGFLLIPKNNSFVICTQTSQTTAYISMVSDVDQVYLAGDENGGLIKITDLITKLNNLENKVNSVITIYNAHTHVASSFGAPTTTPAAPVVGTLTPTVRADIENEIVKHGNG